MSRAEPANPNVCLVCDSSVEEGASWELEDAGDFEEVTVRTAGVAARPMEAVGAY